MLRLVFVMCLLAVPTLAADSLPKQNVRLSVEQVTNVLLGLSALDGYDAPVKDKDGERVIHKQYTLNGATRLAIGWDMDILTHEVQAFQTAKNQLIGQLSPDGSDIKGAKLVQFQAELQKMLDIEKDFQLYTITIGDLRLDPPDSNPIPPSVLGKIQPIIQK